MIFWMATIVFLRAFLGMSGAGAHTASLRCVAPGFGTNVGRLSRFCRPWKAHHILMHALQQDAGQLHVRFSFFHSAATNAYVHLRIGASQYRR